MKFLPSLKALLLATGLAALGASSMSHAQTPGSPDPAFNTGTGADRQVRALALQPDGKVIIGGFFGTVGGVASDSVARLNTDGSVDAGFNPGLGIGGDATNTGVYALAVQADGKILVAGVFDKFNGAVHAGIARLNADGSVDGSFNAATAPGDGIRSVAVQPDGKIVLGGDFQVVNGVTRHAVARINADGSLDAGFNAGDATGSAGDVFKILLQPDGKVLICGNFNTFSAAYLARLAPNGGVDAGFDFVGTSGEVEAIALQTDGKIVLGGAFKALGSADFRQGIARINADGSLDTTFPGDLGLSFQDFFDTKAIAIQADGRIVFGGQSLDDNAGPRGIGRLNADGSLDTTYSVGQGTNNGIIYNVAIQPDNNAVVSGAFIAIGDTTANYVARVVGGPLAPTPTPTPNPTPTPTPTPNPTLPTVTITAKSTKLAENGPKDKVVVTRTGDVSGDLTVNYSAKGSARAGVNYKNLTGSVVIPAGSASTAIKLKPVNDKVRDGTLVLKLTLLPGTAYTIGSPGKAKIKILNVN